MMINNEKARTGEGEKKKFNYFVRLRQSSGMFAVNSIIKRKKREVKRRRSRLRSGRKKKQQHEITKTTNKTFYRIPLPMTCRAATIFAF